MARNPYTHAVIIPHYNDVARLRRCLEALEPQLDQSVEVVVADNGSEQSLAGVRSEFPWATVVTEQRKSAGLARNAGVQATRARWLLFLDSDCIPEPDWLDAGRRAAKENAAVGGRVDVFHESGPPFTGAQLFDEVFAFKMESYLTHHGFLGSGNLIVSREVFDRVGGFRQGVSEDTDWSRRAAAAGVELVYDDRFRAGHPSRADWPDLRKKWRRITSERYQLEAVDALSKLRWGMMALLMPASVLAHLPRIWKAKGMSPGGRILASVALARIRIARSYWMLGQLLSGHP